MIVLTLLAASSPQTSSGGGAGAGTVAAIVGGIFVLVGTVVAAILTVYLNRRKEGVASLGEVPALVAALVEGQRATNDTLAEHTRVLALQDWALDEVKQQGVEHQAMDDRQHHEVGEMITEVKVTLAEHGEKIDEQGRKIQHVDDCLDELKRERSA